MLFIYGMVITTKLHSYFKIYIYSMKKTLVRTIGVELSCFVVYEKRGPIK